MSILGSLIRKREPAVKYRTVDGGHPAPYPEMTDEQLYNYETTFNVARKTFDRPPPSVRARKEPRAAPSAAGRAFDAPRYTARPAEPMEPTFGPEPSLHMPEPEPVTEPAPPFAADPPASDLDLSKPVRTVTTKQPVEILTTRARHPVYKVHGYIGDDEVVTVFTLDGRLSENGPCFLENVPPQKAQLHLNIYRNRDPYAKEKYLVTQHDSRPDADAGAQAERLACVAVQLGR